MADSTFRLKPKSGPGLVVKDDASIDILRGSSGTGGRSGLHPDPATTDISIILNDEKMILRIKYFFRVRNFILIPSLSKQFFPVRYILPVGTDRCLALEQVTGYCFDLAIVF